MQPVYQMISGAARWGDPNKTAVIFNDRSVTYRELDHTSNCAAHGLRARGIAPGNRVAVFMKNSLDMIATYFAIVKAGAVVVPLNVMLRKSEIAYILKDTQASAIIADKDLWERESSVLDGLPGVKLVMVNNGDNGGLWDEFRNTYADKPPITEENIDLDSIVSIIYTSGTTGRPKGATQTHRSVMTSAAGCCMRNKLSQDDRVLCALPLFNNFALNVVMMCSFFSQATLVVLDRFEARKVLDAVALHGCTYFAGTPTMFSYLLMEYKPGEDDLSSLKTTNSGGAPCPGRLVKDVEKNLVVTHLDGYGQTEGCGFTTLNPRIGVRRENSVGTPISDVVIKIMDEYGNELPPGKIGEIVEKGAVFSKHGYWNRPEVNKEVFRDNWFYSGDLGFLDEDGYLYVVDRKQDLIITGGSNIYPAEVEEALYTHPKVAMAAVVGVPDDLKGELPKAYIVLKKDEQATQDEIIEYVRHTIAKYKAPRIVEFVDSLPQGPTGKILKRKLR